MKRFKTQNEQERRQSEMMAEPTMALTTGFDTIDGLMEIGMRRVLAEPHEMFEPRTPAA
jgi:hypothetical protein